MRNLALTFCQKRWKVNVGRVVFSKGNGLGVIFIVFTGGNLDESID
jgi:hypothetical protein